MAKRAVKKPMYSMGVRRGLATSVSLLLILFSLTLVSTIVYTYALNRIANGKQNLRLVAAQEKMIDVDEAISAVAWSPGSIQTLAFSDYGGSLRVVNASNPLQLNLTMDGSTYTVFDSDTGSYLYELPSTSSGMYGRWIRGDERAIVNQSSAYQTQMSVGAGDERQELVARYRPIVTQSVGGLSSGRRINDFRVYIVNLNGSQSIDSSGEFHIRVRCESVATPLYSYDLDASVTTLSVTADLDGEQRTLNLHITTGPLGSTANIELVISYVNIEGVEI